MNLDNDIVLRPRFNMVLKTSNNEALTLFEKAKEHTSEFVISRVDDHVFIRIPKQNQHFWSPQLHLEINEIDDKSSKLYGLFGPNPTVWTLFMFLHFIVILIFIGASIWAYSNWTLNQPYGVQIGILITMVLLWFTLYFIGRIGRAKGKEDMTLLFRFMKNTLNI